MQELLTIRAHLYRIGVLCTNDNPTGILIEPMHGKHPPMIRLYDDWVDATYDTERLLSLLPNATTEDFWFNISGAQVEDE